MNIAPHRRPAAPGFTLVEVLVALLVMAVMAGMAWRGVDGIVRTRDSSQGRLDLTLRINTVLAQWEQDLRAVQDSAVLPQALNCDGASVRLTRYTPTGLQVVAWSLRPDPSGGAWVRWAGPAVTTNTALQDSWLRSLQLQGAEDGSLRALTGLTDWQVYFYQGNGWANCQSTGNLVVAATSSTSNLIAGATSSTSNLIAGAPSPSGSAASGNGSGSPPVNPVPQTVTARQALPSGVRLVLRFAPGSGYGGDVTRDIALGP